MTSFDITYLQHTLLELKSSVQGIQADMAAIMGKNSASSSSAAAKPKKRSPDYIRMRDRAFSSMQAIRRKDHQHAWCPMYYDKIAEERRRALSPAEVCALVGEFVREFNCKWRKEVVLNPDMQYCLWIPGNRSHAEKARNCGTFPGTDALLRDPRNPFWQIDMQYTHTDFYMTFPCRLLCAIDDDSTPQLPPTPLSMDAADPTATGDDSEPARCTDGPPALAPGEASH